MQSSYQKTQGGANKMNTETMGKIIAAKRKELGMTQLDLAEKMGVTDKAVSKWERDLSYPDVNSLPKLAKLFGMSVDELMQLKTESAQNETTQSVRDIVSTILKAICLAMGVAVVVLSAIRQLDLGTAITMLGIGVACAGISLLEKK